MFKESAIHHISYDNKNKGEITERYVIPTNVPSKSIMTIDITELNESERLKIVDLYTQYKEYKNQQLKNIFKFEDWVSQTTGENVTVKWRNFSLDQITEL